MIAFGCLDFLVLFHQGKMNKKKGNWRFLDY